MSIHRLLIKLSRDERGMAAEFALILPLFLLLMLGTIDIGYYTYQLNMAEKSTQVGARWLAVTNPLATEIATADYVNTTVGGVLIEQGDRIPVGAFGLLTCNSTGCTCTTSPCPGTSFDSTAFGLLANRMRDIQPSIQNSNIVVEYSGSGIGYAGDPHGSDVAPLITVRLTGMTYRSIALSPLGTTTTLPDFAYSMTAEDIDGNISY